MARRPEPKREGEIMMRTVGLRGFVLALAAIICLPLASSAQAASHDGQPIQIKTAIGTSLDAYAVGPEDANAGILVLHDRFGLDESALQAADRLAAKGYRVLAIDLFDRRTQTDLELAQKLTTQIDPVWNETNVKAGLAFLRQAGGRKLAMVGWGFGGGVALRSAFAGPADLAAVVNVYGELPSDANPGLKVHCAVLNIFASPDPVYIESRVTAFEESMRAYRRPVAAMKVNAAAGFANPRNPSYNSGAETSAWQRIEEFLAEVMR